MKFIFVNCFSFLIRMKTIRILNICFIFILGFIVGCEEIVSYPDTPIINFKKNTVYLTTDELGNNIALIRLELEFTDGDGDIGFDQPSVANISDTLSNFNFFVTLYDFTNGEFKKVEGLGGTQNYRIPKITREGQNKTLKGTIQIDLEHKSIIYDTIFYSFYLYDRHYNKSNTDSTDVIVLSGIDLN